MGIGNYNIKLKLFNENNTNEELYKKRLNKITIIYQIDKPGENIKIFGSKFIENNRDKCKMVIDFTIKNLQEYYNPKRGQKKLSIVLLLDKKVTDLSYMFHKCSSLISIPDFDDINLNNITNMFSGCSSLKSCPDISKLDTNNVNDMSYIFNGCSSLVKISDISQWDTRKVVNMKSMFSFCYSLKSLPNIDNGI